jgi:hypothetical protein
MNRQDADGLVLSVRIALERIRQGKADRDATACMAEILLLTGFLTEGGFGRLDKPFLNDVEKRLLAEMTQGGVGGEWKIASELVDALVVVVNEYDRLMREPWELSPAYDVTFAHNPVGDWTNQHLMSVNGKFKNFTEDDLLQVADLFGMVGAAQTIIRDVREAVKAWPDFAQQAGVSASVTADIGRQHLLLL